MTASEIQRGTMSQPQARHLVFSALWVGGTTACIVLGLARRTGIFSAVASAFYPPGCFSGGNGRPLCV